MSGLKIGTKPNGILYLDVRLPDPATGELKRARVSCDTRDMAEARRQRADWFSPGVHPKHPAKGGVIAAKGREPKPDTSTSASVRRGEMTVVRWLDHRIDTHWRNCRGRRTILSNVKVLQSVVDEALPLADLSSKQVGEIEAALRERHKYAEGSVKKLMGALSSALNYAVDTEDPKTGRSYLRAKPKFPTYVVRNIRERVLQEAEEKALFEVIAARVEQDPSRPWQKMGWLLEVLLDTGFRLGEALNLGPASVTTKRWIDRRSGTPMAATYLSLPRYTTKSDRPRDVPATQRVQRLIPLLNALAVKGKWFPWAPGSGGPGYFWINLRNDMEERGFDLSDVTLHTMRHTCATRLALGGMDLLALRDWLGHTDIKITAERYVHLMSSHLYQGAEILNLSNGALSSPEKNVRTDGVECGTVDSPPSGGDQDCRVTPTLQ